MFDLLTQALHYINCSQMPASTAPFCFQVPDYITSIVFKFMLHEIHKHYIIYFVFEVVFVIMSGCRVCDLVAFKS